MDTASTARAAQSGNRPLAPADGGRFLLLGEERKLTVEAEHPSPGKKTSDGLRLVAEDPADAERLQALLRAYRGAKPGHRPWNGRW